jgi:hypothetical protein
LENYFNYFTEIEDHFLRRRGGGLLLSTLDWALIETWKDAGIPLEAALRGIDAAFDKYDARPSKTRKVNSLAYCAQEVLAAAEEMKEAVVGVAKDDAKQDSGFRAEEIALFLRRNADALDAATLPEKPGISAKLVAREAAEILRQQANKIEKAKSPGRLEDLERHLTLLEERLFAILLAASPDEQVLAVRAEADRELAPYRRKVPAQQVEQLQKQFAHKRLLEKFNLPRLSLFYM